MGAAINYVNERWCGKVGIHCRGEMKAKVGLEKGPASAGGKSDGFVSHSAGAFKHVV